MKSSSKGKVLPPAATQDEAAASRGAGGASSSKPGAAASSSQKPAGNKSALGKRAKAGAGEANKPAAGQDSLLKKVGQATHSGAAPSHEALRMHTDDLSSDDEAPRNTVGNIPVKEWYKDYEHIGYDVAGQPLAKSASKVDGIDRFLRAQDDINARWTIVDEENDEEIVLSKRDVAMLRNMVMKRRVAHPEFSHASEEYLTADIYTSERDIHPMNDPTEPKRRFMPSKHEYKRVSRIAKLMREGRWRVAESAAAKKPEVYLLWGEDDNVLDGPGRKFGAPPPIRAPKMAPPGHAASYNPPPEYLLTDAERAAWEETDPSHRTIDFIPQRFAALRMVPAYANALKERFERCLDLYLCPRLQKDRLNVTPDALLPQLPDPAELRPFPTTEVAFAFEGHTRRVRSVAFDPRGQYLASGSEDGTARVWEVATGRQLGVWELGAPVTAVAWSPNPAVLLLAAVCDDKLVFIFPGTASAAVAATTAAALTAAATASKTAAAAGASLPVKTSTVAVAADKVSGVGATEGAGLFGAAAGLAADDSEGEGEEEDSEDGDSVNGAEGGAKPAGPGGLCAWETVTPVSAAEDLLSVAQGGRGVCGPVLAITFPHQINRVAWHRKGDYLVTVSTSAAAGGSERAAGGVMVHQLSRHASQPPLRKAAVPAQAALFHPTRPHLVVAFQRSVRVLDLAGGGKTVSKLDVHGSAKWLGTVDVHPSGDHIIAGSYDRRTLWWDVEVSSRPYKSLRYHEKAVRKSVFHPSPSFPLMATASDDGSVHIFHSRVYADFVQNPLIVPVKILRGHKVTAEGLGVLDAAWHPGQPWLATAGADGTVRVWHNLP